MDATSAVSINLSQAEALGVLLAHGLVALACFVVAVGLPFVARRHACGLTVPRPVLGLFVVTLALYGLSRLTAVAVFFGLGEPVGAVHTLVLSVASVAACVAAAALLWYVSRVLIPHGREWDRMRAELHARSEALAHQITLHAQLESQLRVLQDLRDSAQRSSPIQLALDRLNGVVSRLEELYETAEANVPAKAR